MGLFSKKPKRPSYRQDIDDATSTRGNMWNSTAASNKSREMTIKGKYGRKNPGSRAIAKARARRRKLL